MKFSIKVIFLCSFIISFLFIACENKQDTQTTAKTNSTADTHPDIKARLDSIGQILNKAVLENDYNTQLKYFTENVVIAPPMGPVARGKKAVKEGLDINIRENAVFHSFNSTIEDFWVCGERVYERGKWAMAVSSKSQKKPLAYYGSYFEIWKIQKDSSLLIDYMIYTFGFNPN